MVSAECVRKQSMQKTGRRERVGGVVEGCHRKISSEKQVILVWLRYVRHYSVARGGRTPTVLGFGMSTADHTYSATGCADVPTQGTGIE